MTEHKRKMSEDEAIYCLKAESERYPYLCEECQLYRQTGCDHCYEDANDVAIKALEEIQQYRALGTVEELRVAKELYDITTPLSVTGPSITIKNIDALNCILGRKDFYDEEFEKALRDAVKALEKQIPKKPFKTMDKNNPYYKYMPWCCPCCRETLYEDTEWGEQEFAYCTECGQKLNWEEV